MPGATIKRGFQYRSGAETCDFTPPIFWPEAKHHHRVNIRAALRQAIRSCPCDRVPIAVTKDDRAEDLVSFRLEDFLRFINEAVKGADPLAPLMLDADETTDVAATTFCPVTRRQRRGNIRSVMRDAVRRSSRGGIPLAVVIDDGCEPLVTIRLTDFLRVVTQWWARPDRDELAVLAVTQGGDIP